MLSKMQDVFSKTISKSLRVSNVFFLFAAEIEFFVLSEKLLTMQSPEIINFYCELQEFAKKNNIVIESITKEDGLNQFEIQIQPNDLAQELATNIMTIKNQIANLLPVTFEAKPFIDQPGSSLHFHVSLYDKEQEKNLFMRLSKSNDYQKSLYYAVGGLLKRMPQDMKIFAPTENCYQRYKAPQNTKYIHHPTGFNWGFNNRTCAIRIPQAITTTPQNTRIEHRICSSMADPHQSLGAIIAAISEGIESKILPPSPIFGNAFDAQYGYSPLLP